MTMINSVMYLRICKILMLIHFYNYILSTILPHFPQILKQRLHSHNY